MRYLALGDSYTIGTSVDADHNYPSQLAALYARQGIKIDVDIVATRGWTTGNLIDHLPKNEVSYDLVSLLIGVNDLYDGLSFTSFSGGVEELIKRCIDYANGHSKNVRVISLPDYTYTPFAKGEDLDVSSEIGRYNDRLRQLSSEQSVSFIDITDISRLGIKDPDLVADDGLHLSGKAYQLMAERLKASFL